MSGFMPYIKTNWAEDTPITTALLNKIEIGIENAQAKADSIDTTISKITPSSIGAVPIERKINNKSLNTDITLSAADVSAVPTSRKINGKALSGDISLTASDVGAAASNHSHSSFSSLAVSGDVKGGTFIQTDLSKTAEFGAYLDMRHSSHASKDYTTRLHSGTNGFLYFQSYDSLGAIAPMFDNKSTLGYSGNRWKAVYAASGTIQTSDKRQKKDITKATNKDYFDLIKFIDVYTYKLIDDEETQLGVIAQEIKIAPCGDNIVKYDNEVDLYSINPYNLTSAVLAALKEEIKLREQLQQEVEQLRKEVLKSVLQ